MVHGASMFLVPYQNMKKPPALKQTAGLMKGDGRNTCQDPQNPLQLFVRLGCPRGSKQLECLRLLPASALLEVEAGFDGKKPMVRSPLWPIMPNGPAIDGTEEGLLDVPMKLVKQGCLWQNHKNRPNLIL